LQPRLVTEIKDAKGKSIWKFQQQTIPNAKPLKASTITAVKEMMRLVVTKGTAKSLATNDWQLAGKTGTAQVGVDNEKYHKWMVGFAPYAKPMYAVSVVVKNVRDANDNRAKQIYQEVMSALQALNK
jgi:cell division protein FtsI/penicillin-binding protein 2